MVMLVVQLVGLGVGLLQTLPAEAASCPATTLAFGRGEWCGYFGDRLEQVGSNVLPGSPAIPSGIGNVVQFYNFINSQLQSGNAQRVLGAEFIVLTMLGYPAGTARSQGTAQFATWATRLQDDLNQNLITISWNATIKFPCGTVNTFYQPTFNDVAPYKEAGGGCGPTATKQAIVIRSTGVGTPVLYTIKRDCANPLGQLKALPVQAAGYDVTLSANSPTGTGAAPYAVVPGGTYSVQAVLANGGPAASDVGTIEVMYPAVGVTAPCGPVPCSPASQAALLAYGGAKGFRLNSTIAGAVGTNWYWSVGAMPNGGGTSGTLQFTVAPGAVSGSTINFEVYYAPGDEVGVVRHVTVSFRVVTTRMPVVVSSNADVHAGGGLCKKAQTDGSVKARVGSGGEYVVSASAAGGINGFGSNGTGADSLRIGQNGSYAQVCRPDLVAAAASYQAMGSGYTTIGLPTPVTAVKDFDVTGKSGVYFYTGAHLALHGTVSDTVTVVALSGDVVISGVVKLDGATHAARSTPSLGVIASGDIAILAAVTRVDAYLFSDATIDTCAEASVACATSTLVVSGFLMAKDISFHRLGLAGSSGTQVAEQVILTPQIYLNPPKLFDATVDDVLLEGQGERAPLF